MDLYASIPRSHPFNDPDAWAQLVDVTITSREVHLEQLQLFVTGAVRHPALVSKDCALGASRSALWRVTSAFCPSSRPPPPPSPLSPSPPLCAALLSHVARIRREGVLILEGVVQWRRALASADPVGLSLVAAAEGATSAAAAAAFRPYAWNGVDYLQKMLHDTDFLGELAAAPRMLELPLEALQFNPLLAPTTLANAMRPPTLPAVAEHLMNTCVRGACGCRCACVAPSHSPPRAPFPPRAPAEFPPRSTWSAWGARCCRL
jgi:hypothetical protein